MNRKLIVFSGAKASGKDMCIGHIKHNIKSNIESAECKEHLHILTQKTFNIPMQTYHIIYNNREFKETPNPLFKIPASSFYKLAGVLKYKFNYTYSNDLYFTDDRGVDRHPTDSLYSLSIREALVFVSEILIKPTMGDNYFAMQRLKKIVQSKSGIFVDGSYGFDYELQPTIDYLGQRNILGIHINRAGCTYGGDSRSPLTKEVVDNLIILDNNSSEQDLLDRVLSEVNRFLIG